MYLTGSRAVHTVKVQCVWISLKIGIKDYIKLVIDGRWIALEVCDVLSVHSDRHL
jgi:hypothetical protein